MGWTDFQYFYGGQNFYRDRSLDIACVFWSDLEHNLSDIEVGYLTKIIEHKNSCKMQQYNTILERN